jgi:hypothetical protein
MILLAPASSDNDVDIVAFRQRLCSVGEITCVYLR